MSEELKNQISEKLDPSIYDAWQKLGLKVNQMLFLLNWFTNGYNATQAVIDSNYSTNGNRRQAGIIGSRLLNNDKVSKAVKVFFNQYLQVKKMQIEKKVIDVLWKRAFYDITTFQNVDGSFKPLDKIPEKWRCCIDGTETKYYGKDAKTKTVTLKLPDRQQAYKDLMKWAGLLDDKLKVQISGIPKEAEQVISDVFEKAKEQAAIRDKRTIEENTAKEE